MPNGGIMPCCWVCHWGSRNTKESSVTCEQHHLTTYLPLKTFCVDLALENDDSKRRYFLDRKPSPEPDVMCEWLEIAYKDRKYPSIPQYYHEPVDLALLSEFATWNKEQQVNISQARHEQKRQELAKLDS
jgi:hypothetical protein